MSGKVAKQGVLWVIIQLHIAQIHHKVATSNKYNNTIINDLKNSPAYLHLHNPNSSHHQPYTQIVS